MKNLIRFSYLSFLFPVVYARESSYLQGIFESVGTDVFNYILAFILPTFIVYFALNNTGIMRSSSGGNTKGVAGIAGSVGLIVAVYVASTGTDFMGFIMGWFWIVFSFALVLIGYNIFKSFSGINPKENIASGALFLSIISLSFAFIFEGMVEKTSCSTGFGMSLTSSIFDFCSGALVNDALTIGTISGVVSAFSFFSNIPKDSSGEGLGSRIVEGLVSGRRTIPNSDKDDPSNIPPFPAYEAKYNGTFLNDRVGDPLNFEDRKSSLWPGYDTTLHLTASMSARFATYQNNPAAVAPPLFMSEADRAAIAKDFQDYIERLIIILDTEIADAQNDSKEIKLDISKIKKLIKRFQSSSDPIVSTNISNYRNLLSNYTKSNNFYKQYIELLKADKIWITQYKVNYSDRSIDAAVCSDFENRFRTFKNIINFNPAIFKNITPGQITQRKELHLALDRMHII